MQKEIHPKYYEKAKVTCACGNTFTVGATVPEIRVEICSKCHPFYTGREQLIDTAGRVERFKARRTKAASAPKKDKKARVAKNKNK
ncbi:MAG: 50S ribosomal protein L31 [Chloroflexi bacterium]|nr:50S ribosomal protein L31 [Chloroflexota bacterium]